MATIKSYTDLNQSRKLAEILPLESADMSYYEYTSHIDGTPKVGYKEGITEGVPCWSLSALIDILPEVIIKSYYDLQKENSKYFIVYFDDKFSCEADNPVDACVEMIIRLHELKLL